MNTKTLAAALAATTVLTTACGQSPEAQFISRCKDAIQKVEAKSIKVQRQKLTNFGSSRAFEGVAPDPSHSQMVMDYSTGGVQKRRICTPMAIAPTTALEWPRSVPVPEPAADAKLQLKLDSY